MAEITKEGYWKADRRLGRGGKRRGAGRPLKYGEPQKQMRIPLGLVATVLKLITDYMKTKEKTKCSTKNL